MKICYIAGANSIHSYKWIKYFSERHEVYWISLTPNDFDLPVYVLKEYKFKVLNLLNIFKIIFLLRRIKPDIIHAHYAGVNGFLTRLVSRNCIITAWGSDILKANLFKRILLYYTLQTDLITCDSERMKDKIRKYTNSRIEIINFGIDTKKFRPLKIKKKYDVISTRTLKKIYDVETLIKAVPFVLKEFPKAKFIVAGEGDERKKLEKMADKSVEFIGFIPNDELPQYLNASKVYVSTSLSDAGISASTAEAMACNVPVIITNNSENKKWTNNLFEDSNYRELAEKIISTLKNPPKGEREIIQQNNDYYLEMEKMNKLYEIIKKN